ncbi:sulfurtransferase [bacterium]|nr:MAG: sulfurtransferase [bacterium]
MTDSKTDANPPRWPFKPELEISAPDTAALHKDAGTTDFLLIDIRESNELETSSIAGALHIPMGDIPARINELDVDEDTTIAILCRSGKRSLQVAQYMQQQGLAGTRSVAGGINWWGLKIDPSIQQY